MMPRRRIYERAIDDEMRAAGVCCSLIFIMVPDIMAYSVGKYRL